MRHYYENNESGPKKKKLARIGYTRLGGHGACFAHEHSLCFSQCKYWRAKQVPYPFHREQVYECDVACERYHIHL